MTEQENSQLAAEYADWQAPETTGITESGPSRFSIVTEKIDNARGALMVKLQEKIREEAGDDPARAYGKEQAKDNGRELIEHGLTGFKELFSVVRAEQKTDPALTSAVHDGGSMSGSALILGLVGSRVAKSVGRFLSR